MFSDIEFITLLFLILYKNLSDFNVYLRKQISSKSTPPPQKNQNKKNKQAINSAAKIAQ